MPVHFCVYVDSYFLAVQGVNDRFLFFSSLSPSRNQVNTAQSMRVIFPFKYGNCKHKNNYTSVKLLSQREYTITKRKALAPLHPKGSCINSKQSFVDSSHGKSSDVTVLISSCEMSAEDTVYPNLPYTAF